MFREEAIAKGAGSLYAANIAMLVANTVYYIFLTRSLSTIDVGVVTTLNILIILLVSISVLAQPFINQSPIPAPLALLKFLPVSVGDGSWKGERRIFLFFFTLTGGISGVMFLFMLADPSALIPLLGGNAIRPIFIQLAGFDTVVLSLANVCLVVVIAVGSVWKASIQMVLWSIVRYFSATLLLYKYAVVGVLAGFIIGDLFLFALAMVESSAHLMAHESHSDVSSSKMLSYSAYTLSSALMGFAVSQADKIVALVQGGLRSLAIYNIAVVAANFTGLAPYALLIVILPMLTTLRASGKSLELHRMIGRCSRLVILAIIPVSFGFASLAELALRIFGREYVVGYGPSAIVSIALGLTGVGSVYAGVLLAMDEMRWYSAANLLGLVVLLISSSLLTPVIGLDGPAIGRAGLLFVTAVLYMLAARRRGLLELDFKAISFATISSAIMSAFLFLAVSLVSSLITQFIILPALIVLGGLIYLVLIRTLGVLDSGDLLFAMQVTPLKLRWIMQVIAKIVRIDLHASAETI